MLIPFGRDGRLALILRALLVAAESPGAGDAAGHAHPALPLALGQPHHGVVQGRPNVPGLPTLKGWGAPLAWVTAAGDDVVPVVGVRRRAGDDDARALPCPP